MPARFIVLAFTLVAACTKAEPAPESAACCTNEAAAAVPAAAPASNAATANMPELAPGDVVVSGRVTREGAVISVQNHAAISVKLKPTVRVEHRAGDRWLPVVATGLALRFSCASEQVDCVTLAPGAELLPPLWPAVQGRGACAACAECPAIAAGEYRLVIEACDGNSTVASEAFTIAPER